MSMEALFAEIRHYTAIINSPEWGQISSDQLEPITGYTKSEIDSNYQALKREFYNRYYITN